MFRDRWAAFGLAMALFVGPACDRARVEASETAAPPPVVSTGELEEHLLLSGEVDASSAVELGVPRTDEWNISIRWLAEDGASVKKGDVVVAFDNTAVIDRISERELAAIEAAVDLETQEAEAEVEAADKKLEVAKQETEVAKATLDASVPDHLLSRKEARDFAVAKSRAEVALTQARGELDKTVRGGKLEAGVKKISFDKALRAYERTESQLDALEITASRDGIFLVGKHMWEDRKVQVADNVWPGFTVGRLPDLSKLVIEANLSDVDEGRIQPGMVAVCTVDAYPDRPLTGVIEAVSPVAQQVGQQTQRRFFRVLVELDGAGDTEGLRPGLSVSVDVVTRRAHDAVLAPRAGLDMRTDPPRARLADGTDVEIEVDFCDAHHCAVRSGLEAGQELRREEGQP